MTRLVAELRRFGLPVWRDSERLRPGERWRTRISQAIREGDAFVAVFSSASEERERTYMREEVIQAADELRLRPATREWFFPVVLSKCELPHIRIGPGETLDDLQYVDLALDWDAGVQRLAVALQDAVTRVS